MTVPFKWSNEFLINTTTASNQFGATSTGLADGRFVVAWTDDSNSGGDTSSLAVRAQVFNADGTKFGTEFLVNTTTTSSQFDPTITALDDGRFVVAWADNSTTGGDTSGGAVRAQVFNADGSKFGTEFLANTTTASTQSEPAITALADGRFVVAWTDASTTGADTSEFAVRAQVFNADGSKFGIEFVANTTTTLSQNEPTIKGLADGRFVVAWTDTSSTGGDTSGSAVRAKMFNADGSPSGTEFLVNTTTAGPQHQPTLTALADGRFVVAWRDLSATGGDTSAGAVRAQVFNANGSKSGTEFLVNTTTTGDQQSPSITGLSDGRFVVAWMDPSATGGDTSNAAVRAQVFDIDGTKSGAEFLVNTATINGQYQPTVSELADGRFVLAWTDESATPPEGGGAGIRGQIFDPRTSAVTLNGTTFDDNFVGTGFGDHIAGFDGNDKIDGALGDDTLDGEDGNDTLFGRAGNDIVRGGNGDDTITGELGDDRLIGDAGNDSLDGGFGRDHLNGGIGNDTLLGRGGADTFIGGAGQDTMTGGAGIDKFDFNLFTETGKAATTRDKITDFVSDATAGGGPGSGDFIDLSDIDAKTGAGNQAFIWKGAGALTGAGQLHYRIVGGVTLIEGEINGKRGADFVIELDGTAHALTATDFIL